jgi:hypothetical protein
MTHGGLWCSGWEQRRATAGLVVLLLAAAISAATAQRPGAQGLADDLLVAFPTHASQLPVVEASRVWRSTVHTVVVVDAAANTSIRQSALTDGGETFVVFPSLPGWPYSLRCDSDPF